MARHLFALVALAALLPEAQLQAPPVCPHSPPPSLKTAKFIFGGVEADKCEIPFFAYVRIEHEDKHGEVNVYRSGASILTPRWVLTTAHSILRYDSGTVYVGVTDVRNLDNDANVQAHAVEEVIRHPDFEFVPLGNRRRALRNDIALLKLATPIRFNRAVRPVLISRNGNFQQDLSYVAYGAGKNGYDADGNPTYSNALKYASVPLISNEECRILLRNHDREYQLQPHYFCGGSDHKGPLGGDSGGPLTAGYGNIQVGIIQGGNAHNSTTAMDQRKFPAIFVKTADYCDWMESTADGFGCGG